MAALSETALREVFHLLFLERLFAVSSPAQYVLKGGVNLRFFFASPRYSEDMDVDVFAGSVETLKKKKNGFKFESDPRLRVSGSFGPGPAPCGGFASAGVSYAVARLERPRRVCFHHAAFSAE